MKHVTLLSFLIALMLPRLSAAEDRVPLAVIRFQQEDVRYEPSLYQAVKRAVDLKPDATFEAVSVLPQAANPKHEQRATLHADRFLKVMRDMGVPEEQLAITTLRDNTVAVDEIRLYVK